MSYSKRNEIDNASTNCNIEQYLQRYHDCSEDADLLDGLLCSLEMAIKVFVEVTSDKAVKIFVESMHMLPTSILYNNSINGLIYLGKYRWLTGIHLANTSRDYKVTRANDVPTFRCINPPMIVHTDIAMLA